MEAVFQAPKRRPKVYESFERPLPIPFSKEASQPHRSIIYKAEVINQHVVVREPEHIQALYGEGYFGKGILSKSRPEHSISQRWEYIGDKCLPVITLSTYQKHVNWARSALLAQELDEEVVTQVLQKLTHPVELTPGEEHDEPANHQASRGSGASQAPDHEGQDQPTEFAAADERLADGQDFESHEAKKPRRQGDPVYDPLAELHPQEPEPVDPNALAKVRCKRHDDWVVHCGCRLDESQIMGILLKSDTEDRGPSIAYGYVLVEEPGEEDRGDPSQDASVQEPQLVCRINPFNMMEHLQLSYEEASVSVLDLMRAPQEASEGLSAVGRCVRTIIGFILAFFLVYALGCLSVYYDGEPLSVRQLWKMFCAVQPNFEVAYAAYHYFRSKGWVPKSGIKYGTDLMLYRKGPPFYHASYSVVVERVNESFQGATLRPFSWRSFAALSRITGNVSKELMLCYVIMPSDLKTEDVSTPDMLKRVKVQELVVSRWISSRERTEQDEI